MSIKKTIVLAGFMFLFAYLPHQFCSKIIHVWIAMKNLLLSMRKKKNLMNKDKTSAKRCCMFS